MTHILDYSTLSKEALTEADSHEVIPNIRSCKYCMCPLQEHGPKYYDGWGMFAKTVNTLSCPGCGWWVGGQISYFGDGRFLSHELYYGVLRKYPVAVATLPVETLRLALERSPDLLYKIDTRKMEELVGAVFRDHYDCAVHHVGRTGDGGVDLLLVEGNEEVVVQVKRRTSKDATEGVSLIREVIGATLLAGKLRSTVVTTGRFTRGATQSAKEAVRLGIVDQLELIDMPRFVDMLHLSAVAVEPPWVRALKGKILGVDGAGVICNTCGGSGTGEWKVMPNTLEDEHTTSILVENCAECNGSGRLKRSVERQDDPIQLRNHF